MMESANKERAWDDFSFSRDLGTPGRRERAQEAVCKIIKGTEVQYKLDSSIEVRVYSHSDCSHLRHQCSMMGPISLLEMQLCTHDAHLMLFEIKRPEIFFAYSETYIHSK